MGAGGSSIQANRLKRATKDLVRSLGGNEVAAADLGKGKSTVHRWTDRHDTESFINIHDLATLEAAAPEPSVTKLLCRMAGGVFVAVPEGEGDTAALAEGLMEIMHHVGIVAGETQRAIADGCCDAREAETVRAEVARAMAALAAFDRQLEVIERGEVAGSEPV